MSLSNAHEIATADINFATNIITAGVATWIGYDYLLTVRQESRLFWKRKVTTASMLFFLNRYLAVFYYVVLAWSVLAFPVDLYGDFHHRIYSHDPTLRCMSTSATPTFLSLMQVMVSFDKRLLTRSAVVSVVTHHCTGFIRGGQSIADIVVIGVTWKATHEARREGSMSSLMRVMFKNGTLYFIVLLLMNIFHILFIFLPNSALHIPSSNTSYVPKVSEPLTAILVSRFMLDLHEAHAALAHKCSDLSTIQIMSLNIPQPYSSESEDLEDWAVASTSSRTEPETGSETEPERASAGSLPCTNRSSETV